MKSIAATKRSRVVHDDSVEEEEEDNDASMKSKRTAKKVQVKVLNGKKKPAGAQMSPRGFAPNGSTYLQELIAQLETLSEDERHVRGPLYLDVRKEEFNYLALMKADRYFFKPLI
jgi:hypothetical protein